jgi:voltage-gated potassium channel
MSNDTKPDSSDYPDHPVDRAVVPKEIPAIEQENPYPSAEHHHQLEALPQRHRGIHWAAFIMSVVSFILLAVWGFGKQAAVPPLFVWLDSSFCALFAFELFTRSGFRWSKGKYLITHFFDFFALVPALFLMNHGIIAENIWVWLVMVARTARVIDRFWGDGFLRRTFWALAEGFEEEITDRVLENIIARLQSDMDRAEFSRGIAKALEKNKPTVLGRIKKVTPTEGVVPKMAHLVGLDAALERAEEKTYDALIRIVSSREVDQAVRDVINSAFSRVRNELGHRSWRDKIKIRWPW